jgi:AGZA family xanthine/uracil permease-like MFS transporter
MFDTLGTVIACSNQAGLVKKNGTVERLSYMLGVDAVATMISGLLGTSPTTSYIESATGIAAGGRTGLTAIVTGLLFLLGLLFIPLIEVVPIYATAPALVIVGIFMVREVVNIDFEHFEESIPAILTLIVMPLTFSISVGMAFGFISWVLIKVLLLKFRQIPWIMYLIMALSLTSLLV